MCSLWLKYLRISFAFCGEKNSLLAFYVFRIYYVICKPNKVLDVLHLPQFNVKWWVYIELTQDELKIILKKELVY